MAEVEARLADPGTYAGGPELGRSLNAELETLRADVDRLMARWEELESKR